MTNPGQQQDEQHATLEAKQAEQGKLIGQLIQSLDAFGSRLQDVEAEQQTHADIIYNLLPPSEPEPEPEPEQPVTPEPEPDFDLESIHHTVEPGQVYQVAAINIPDGTEVWVHWFDSQWGSLVRSTAIVVDGNVSIEIPEVLGDRILQLQVAGLYKEHIALRVERLFEPEPTPPQDTETLTPGNGWTGPAEQPPMLPGATEPVVAHWNVVPEQQIHDGFTVGVIAHHLDGIAFVSIRANGGKAVLIPEPSVNPRTGCLEYWTTIRNPGDKPLQLRAVAYPHRGQPTIVSPIGSEYSKQDLTLYPYEVGEVLELDSGEHRINPRSLPATGWLTIRPKPGAHVVIVGESQNWKRGRLRFQGVTIKCPSGNNTIRGEYQGTQPIVGQHVWFDNCRIIGNGPGKPTSWIAHMWETATYTDCEISDVQVVFHGYRGITTLARNCHIHNIYEDVFRSGGLHVNITIENVDREVLAAAQGITDNRLKPHPDLWQFGLIQNTIIQDVTATKNINAQGFFPSRVRNVALVRTKLATVAPYRVVQIMGDTENLLFDSCDFLGGHGFRGTMTGRVVVRATPALQGWQGVEVQQ